MPPTHETKGAEALSQGLSSLAQQIREVTKSIQSNREVLGSSSALKQGQQDAVDAAEALLATIQPPDPLKTNMVGLVQFTAIHLLSEWKAFDFIQSAGTIAYSELAKKLDADTALICK